MLTLKTPTELAAELADRVRAARLARGWTQAELAERTQVALPTYRLFERTGRISLERLITITSALGRAAEWEMICSEVRPTSLDDVDRARPTRKRGIRRARPSGAA